MVSANSIASKWVKEEWKFFQEAGKRVLPILLEECKALATLRKIEMIKVERADWYHRLLKAIAP